LFICSSLLLTIFNPNVVSLSHWISGVKRFFGLQDYFMVMISASYGLNHDFTGIAVCFLASKISPLGPLARLIT